MSGRYRTVGLQAVGVAILAAIVFIAFLRPSEPGDLSGIEAPGGESEPPVVINPGEDDDKGKDKGKGKGKDSKSDKGKNGPAGAAGGRADALGSSLSGPGGGAPGLDGAGDPVPPSGGSGGPPDDQYTDLVSLLMRQVGEPTMWREINGP